MTMENPPFEDVMSYRNYSNCSLRKSISVPFFADPQIAFPQKMQQNRLRGRFFKKSFFGKIEAKAYPGIFHVERIYFLPSPPQKNPLRWWFFNRQASYMSNLGVSNRFFFWGCQEQIDYLLPRWESWALRAEPAREIIIGWIWFCHHHLEGKRPFAFPFTKKNWRAFWEISWVFPELVQFFFFGNFKNHRNFK